ncbi:MAG: ABC transporter ATP-binding protein [Pseudomonadota bacterium]
MPTAVPLLEVEGLTKRFGDFTALDAVSLSLMPGERHALVGENGAGKSTLVKTLYGLLAPDAGVIRWQGAPARLSSPAEARATGIGMVFQHFSLFDALSVTENIAIALPHLSLGGLAEKIDQISREVGLPLDPDRRVHSLSAGQRQRVEVVRCLLQNPRLLILDEPTSVLTPQEADTLFEAVRRLSDKGCALLYITHRLAEVTALCQRATVLRRGRLVGHCDPAVTPAGDIAEMMVGDKIAAVARPPKPDGEPKTRLRLRALTLSEKQTGGRKLRNIYLEVKSHEIVGIAGVAGEGQNELVRALTGEIRLPLLKGAIEINQKRAAHRDPASRRRLGAAFVPEDRSHHATVPAMGLDENLMLSHHGEARMTRGGFLNMAGARAWVDRVREAFDVRASTEKPVAASLSGGNLQKFIMGREILRKPRLLVVDQPTWGVDAAAAARIRQALVDLAADGAGVLIISQDLDELFALSDRIAVMYRGRLSTARETARLDARLIGLMMAGQKVEVPPAPGEPADAFPDGDPDAGEAGEQTAKAGRAPGHPGAAA